MAISNQINKGCINLKQKKAPQQSYSAFVNIKKDGKLLLTSVKSPSFQQVFNFGFLSPVFSIEFHGFVTAPTR